MGELWLPTRREFIKAAGAGLVAVAAMPLSVEAMRAGKSTPFQALANWGFNNVTLFDDFTSISTIDVNNTLAPGFNWYCSNAQRSAYVIPSSAISVSSSVLSFLPTSAPGGSSGVGLATCGWTGNPGTPFVGNAIAKGGGYFEAMIQHTTKPGTTTGWPAFWMYDNQITLNLMNNTSFGGNAYAELDHYEYFGGTNFQCTDWEWQGSNTFFQNSNVHMPFTISNTFTFNSWHAYGCLWVPPARNNGIGLIQRFIDGVHQPWCDVMYQPSIISPQAVAGARTGWMSSLETSTLGYNLQLQTGSNWQVNYDWVRVTQ